MFFAPSRSRSWHMADGEQRARGPYLLLLSRGRELRALVRTVELRQLGHYMMGHFEATPREPRGAATIQLSLSGAYGSDGLPRDGAEGSGALLWNYAHPVPAELAEAYWHSDGHNGPGREGPAMRAWAEEHEHELRKLAKRRE